MKGSRRLFAIAMITGVAGFGILCFWHKSSAGFAEGIPASNSALNQDLKAFAALNPIDAHAHVLKSDPAFFDMLRQLHLQLVDICVVDGQSSHYKGLQPQLDNVLSVVRNAKGRVWLCTTFKPLQV